MRRLRIASSNSITGFPLPSQYVHFMDAAERSHEGVSGPSDQRTRTLSVAARRRTARRARARCVLGAASPLLRMAGRGDRHPGAGAPRVHRRRSVHDAVAMVPAESRMVGAWLASRPELRADTPHRHRHSGTARRASRAPRPQGVDSSDGASAASTPASSRGESPMLVRQVITLGSPFRMVDGDRSWASGMYETLSPTHRAELLRIAEQEEDRDRLAVPSTAIYSRTDGIVRWHTCIDEQSDRFTRTSKSAAATAGWATTRRCSRSSPIGWHNRKASGGPSGPTRGRRSVTRGPRAGARAARRSGS